LSVDAYSFTDHSRTPFVGLIILYTIETPVLLASSRIPRG